MKLSKKELEKYSAFYLKDNEFTSYCRYLQSKWRESKNYPMDSSNRYGNYIDLEFSKNTKNNFLTEKIKEIVTNEVRNSHKSGKLISEPRIWNNLLSSQPLAFNLFGELHSDTKLSTQFFQNLFPSIIEKIIKIDFEYSPGRRNKKYTGDRSAFDVFVEYESKDSRKKGFLGIEVKYTETLAEESKKESEKIFERHKSRYLEITNQLNIYKDASLEKLKVPPLSQIWRDHLLAISLIQDYDEGYFVFLSPEKNTNCEISLDKYQSFFKSEISQDNLFLRLTLEDCIKSLEKITNAEWVTEFKTRYIGN